MEKPKIIIVDWKAGVFDDPKENAVYNTFYKPLEEKFECLPFFSSEEVPEEVFRDNIHAIILHPSGRDDEVLRNRIPKFILSSYPGMDETNWSYLVVSLGIQDITHYVKYDPDAIKTALENSL